MQKRCSAVDEASGESQVQFCREQYCTGTWPVRPMNQGKLGMIKEEMARLNFDISGISELKWTGMGEFNSDDHYIYCCGQESLRKNTADFIVNKRVRKVVLGCSLKNQQNGLTSIPRLTIQNHSNTTLCPNH